MTFGGVPPTPPSRPPAPCPSPVWAGGRANHNFNPEQERIVVMSLFKKAESTNAYLKMGVYGDCASGKTYTASLVARGLGLLIGKNGQPPPVMFLDTETGATWVRPIIEGAGLPFLVHSSRAFTDLQKAVAEAEQARAILIVNSVTHFWEEIRKSYLAAKRKRLNNPHARLELPDWNVIKPVWGRFTAAFLNSRSHVILCGRGASIYEFVDNEDTGKKDLITNGTRMAAEKGLGYEPSLLVEMTQRQVTGTGKRKSVVRTATVLKDRSDRLDGLQFDDPTFENFLPHIEQLNLGGQHVGVDTSRTSDGLFSTEGAGRDTQSVRRRIVLDDAKDLLLRHVPGQAVADKQRKAALVRKHFGCGWVEAEELMPLDALKQALASLTAELEPPKPAVATDPIDEVPHTGADAAPDTVADVPAAKQPSAAAVSILTDQLANSIIKQFEEDMEKVHNATRCSQLWKSYEPSYHKLDETRQGRMLLIKQRAETRIMLARAKARDAAVQGADAEAARAAAQ